MTRRVKMIGTVLLAALATAALLFPEQTPGVRGPYNRHKLLKQIELQDPAQRKQAAWAAIDHPSNDLEAVMVRGLLGHEPDADVREAYAYSLGNIDNPRNFAALERALDTDPSGFVRCSAWLAAVRIDPDHFITLADANTRTDDPWDRLGIAQARLSIGDAHDVGVLFEQARSRDETRRIIAFRSLNRWLKPSLDAVGRWPLDFQPQSGQDWPTQWLEEIERRCATFDLSAVASRTHAEAVAASRVHRNIARINGAREGLIRFLFGPGEELR